MNKANKKQHKYTKPYNQNNECEQMLIIITIIILVDSMQINTAGNI